MQGIEDPVEAYNRGLEHLDYNEPDLAIDAFSQAIELRPNYVQAWFGRGFAHFTEGDFHQALRDYTEALRIDPSYAAAYQNRAAAYRALGRTEEAVADDARYRQLRRVG